jgi:Zn-dependent M32 family carboxypeptidase|tara:strand:+ start:1041 stop:1508 length:468 start_codon:yes stop_codon:yes gene_type:complete
MEQRNFTPSQFFRYISQPLSKDDIEVWIKVNGIVSEKSDLFFDFVTSLYKLVNKTYLGDDVIKEEEDKVNHFNWCWNKVLDNFQKENIVFEREGPHYSYFWNFFDESFYSKDVSVVIERLNEFFPVLFKFNRRKTKSELDLFTDLYKLLDNNLRT